MASVSSRPQQFRPLVVVACFFSSCLLMMIPCTCSSSDGGAAAAAAAFHGYKRDTVDIVGRALICFNDRYIYIGCQGSFRLGPEGALDVPPASADAFCGGPCLAETELVLRCVDAIMANFRFYNGASAGDVRFALDRGCGHSGLRGDFGVLQRTGGGGGGDGYLYGRGDAARRRSVNNLAALLLGAATAILVWA